MKRVNRKFQISMHSGYKLLVIFGAKRRRSLGNVCKHRSMVSLFSIMDLMAVSGFSLNMLNVKSYFDSISLSTVSISISCCLKEPPCAYSANNHRWLALSFREQLTRFYHMGSSSPRVARADRGRWIIRVMQKGESILVWQTITVMKVLFLYFNLCISVMLESLSCSFTLSCV